MIDFQTEKMIPITEAPKHIPGRPNITTVVRWFGRGVRGVKLETMLIGGRRVTSFEALARFFAATTAAADGEPVQSRTPRQRERDINSAESELAKAGW